MSKKSSISVLFASSLILLAGDVTAQASQSKTVKTDEISLSGCPVQISESCIMLMDSRGTPYDITASPAWASAKAAKQALTRHRSIQLSGSIAEGASGSCRRGVVLKDIRWSYGDRKCASAPVLTKP